MKWRIDYSKDAAKFIKEHNISFEVREELKKFLMKMKGENVNVDVKKLTGDWEGYYRLRKGKLRIIFELNKHNKVIFVERIDFRGEVYK
uniref:Addiction module toxin RelE n=1 Tax=Thermodesulfobacterium geofontis TaxID=1295609 RepID=A0A7V5XFW8_9BACT